MLLANLGLFILSCLVLIIAGYFTIKSLTKISKFLRISEFVAGFIIMAIATTLPELFVGINSALAKNTALILGTVIGSIIVNITLILGIAIVLARNIEISSPTIRKNAWFMLFLISLPIIMIWINKGISKIGGIVLVCISIVYFYRTFKQSRTFTKAIKDKIKRWEGVIYPLLFLFTTLVLFFSAKYVVKYATLLSIDLNLAPILIGLFLVALGTSLPELIFSTEAVLQKHPDMVIGDIIGACIMNATLILGISSIIYPITADIVLFFTSAIFMIVTVFLLITFIESENKLTWKEGVSLILFYVLFIIIELNIKGIL